MAMQVLWSLSAIPLCFHILSGFFGGDREEITQTSPNILQICLLQGLHRNSVGYGLVIRLKYPPLSRDRWSNTPVALCFLWYRRLSLLHTHFFLIKNSLSQSKERPNKAGIAEKACL